MRTSPIFILLISVICCTSARGQDELNVVNGDNQWLEFTDARNALYHHFARQAFDHLDKRRKLVKSISTADGWKERQSWIRETLFRILGPFPEKSPLNARIVRTVEKDGYRIEHIIYESQPKFYVTASLFIPSSLKRRDKAPAVIYCSGHSEEGYRSKVYQHVIVNLVRKGFVVFAFDPVGQGERLEYLDTTTNKSSVGGPTAQHSYPGSQAFIAGSSQARYMIWDGIRAVDYLLTRKEIDPNRIGITGRSGGGTQSAYIAALDDRILAAAPECYITNFTRLLQSIGPQDAEQNFPGGISNGIDQGDLLIVRAPKPALMITTTRDIFNIQGARETEAEVSRTYHAFGAQKNFGMVEDDAGHASTQKNREAMYAFFQLHLKNPGSSTDVEVALPTPTDLQVTSTGQVATSLGGETIQSLVVKSASSKTSKGDQNGRPEARADVVEQAKRISGYRPPSETADPVFTGRIQRDGYTIEKYFLAGEGDYIIPYLLMKPSRTNGRTILYIHPAGKSAEAGVGGQLESLIRKGFTVVSPDLAGMGEMGAGDFTGDAFIGGVSHNIWYASILVGRSIVGLQSGDIARLVNTIKKNSPGENIFAVAHSEMAPVLLHAAAFIPEIERIALVRPLVSYRSLVETRLYHSGFIPGAVAGSINEYDLPQLAASLAPRKLLIVEPVDGAKKSLKTEALQRELSFIKEAFSAVNKEAEFVVVEEHADQANLLPEEWLK
jgi:hypothetical protein